MRLKLYTALVLIVTLIVSIGFYFILEATGFKIEPQALPMTIYWVAKGFSIATLVVLAIALFNEKEISNQVILIRLTIMWQFVPLVIRLFMIQTEVGVTFNNTKLILPTIFLAFALIGYLILFGMIEHSNAKIKEAKPKFEGKISEVPKSNSYYDENNNFIGANGKDEDVNKENE